MKGKKQTKDPEEMVKKMIEYLFIHIMECCTTIKKTEILLYVLLLNELWKPT